MVDLNTELRKYDLFVNDKKTEVSELPIALTKQWKRQIGNTKLFFRNGLFDYISVRSYFDCAIDIMQKNNDDSAILNYAIKTLPVEDMTAQAKILAVKTIFHLCLLYPYLVHIIDEFVFERFNVEKKEINDFTNQLFTQELAVKNYDAVCYALFFSMKYNFEITNLYAKDVVESDSCIFKLFAFLQFKKYKNSQEKAVLRKHAISLKKNDEDFDRNWLFIYEILSQSELSGHWQTMKQDGISFIKQEFQV